MQNKLGIITITTAACLLLSGCGSAQERTEGGSTSADAPLAWQRCGDFTEEVAEMFDALGEPSPLTGYESRLECATVPVPLDYSEPDGELVELAVTRLLPEGESRGDIFVNPGGPGLEARTMPAMIAASAMGDIATDHTLIAVDLRGTGGSSPWMCLDEANPTGPEEDSPGREAAQEYAETLAEANRKCATADADFVESLTTQNAARDLDSVRRAMGVSRVSYFGASWGTELGMTYISMFPDTVERMLLDSITDIRGDEATSLDDIAAAMIANGAASEEGDGTLSAPGYTMLSVSARTAYTCNANIASNRFEDTWQRQQDREERFPGISGLRLPHPVASQLPGVSACTGWPFDPQPIAFEGSHDGLQLVGHTEETVTPAVWAERAHEVLGGELLMLPDGVHGSLAQSDRAEQAVEFLRNGTPMG